MNTFVKSKSKQRSLESSPIAPISSVEKSKPNDIPARYEKEWDDVEQLAADALDRQSETKKEDI